MADPSYVRGTNEFKSITVTADGAPVLTNVFFSVVAEAPGVGPGQWTAASTAGGKVGFYLGGYAPGCWHIFVKDDAGTEQPFMDAGIFYIR